MIEIVCKDKLPQEEGKLCLPKNIRQVGSPRGRHKIYIEDYVYTYLRATAQKKESCAVVFLGNSQIAKDIRYTFISGALECGFGVFQWDNICLDENFWQKIERENKQFFPEKQIVGWFLGKAGQAMELTSVVEAAHRKYFSGRDKVLMLMDVLEGEETFFIYDQGYLQKREGYYIYFEKNLPMQEYMIHKKEEELRMEELAIQPAEPKRQGQPEFAKLHSELESGSEGKALGRMDQQEPEKDKPSSQETGRQESALEEKEKEEAQEGQEAKEPLDSQEEFRKLRQELAQETGAGGQEKIFAKSNLEEPKTQAEEALESYRHMILEKQGRQIARQNRKFLYTASSFFMVVVCVLGITTINNYRKMQEVEDVLHVMRDTGSGKKRSETGDGPVVESVMSQVDPLEGQEDEAAQTEGDKPSAPQDGSGQEGSGSGQPEGQPQEGTGQEGAVEGSKTGQPEGQPQEGSGQEGAVEGSGTEQPEEGAESQGENSGESEETSVAQPQQPRYYTVKAGDTLASICIDIYHDRSMMKKVCEANGIENSDKIYVGQRLTLP